MPTVQITTRYKSFSDDTAYYNQLKQRQRTEVLKNYPGATDLNQTIITDGIPDAITLGELRANGQVAVRAEFTVTEEQAAEIKKGMRQ